ncbi:protein FAM216B-like isoform X2 [Chiloscyllium plagiosum]|nr:protein FAM216B-like isoform X2 [Chiloscyllium plagiosum]
MGEVIKQARLSSSYRWPPEMTSCVKIPRSMLHCPLLKDLSTGQQRYLSTIITIYRAAPLRRSLHQQYINSLTRQMTLGYISAAEMDKFLDFLKKPKQQQYRKQSPSLVRTVKRASREQSHCSQLKSKTKEGGKR